MRGDESVDQHVDGAGTLERRERVGPGEEADSAPEVRVFRGVIVQKFRRTFVLANLHVSVVRNCRNHAIVSDLVGMVGGTAPLLMNGRNRLRVGYLVARVPISGQAKLIGDPLAKMA